MKNKRGIQLSFGFIFSVILIAVIVFVGFYAISKFMGITDCANTAVFYDDFRSEVNRAWNSEIYQGVFEGNLPKGIEEVCLGNLSETDIGKYEDLETFFYSDFNVFLRPVEKACVDSAALKINHLEFDFSGIECFRVRNGKIALNLKKGSFDANVILNGREVS